VRPFFPFYGSKWNIARYYPAPRHDVIVEPFAGAAGYSTFYGAPRARLIDADPIITGIWQYLIRATPEEILALPDLPDAGDSVGDHPRLPQEARWLIGFWLNRGSAQPKLTRTAYSARADKGQLNWGPRAKQRIASQLEGIRGWKVHEGDYSDAPAIDATWFVDPPYVDKGRFYRVPFSSFPELGDWVHTRSGQVIVCEGRGADWLDFRPLGHFKTSTGRALEVVFLNEGVSA
jgi:hypothetical protein